MQQTNLLTEISILTLILVALIIIYYYTRRYRKPSEKQDHYLQALEYLVDGDVKRAIQKFKEAIRENTENIQAYLRLGDLLRERGLARNALKIHKDLTLRSNLSAEYLNKVQKSLMLDYEALGDFKNATESALQLLAKESPPSKESASKLISYLEKQEKWGEAFEAAKKYFKPVPQFVRQKMALYRVFEGLKLEEKSNGKEARIKFKEALRQDPKCAAAYYYMGHSYIREERLEDAVNEWQALCTHIPEKAHVIFDDLEKAWFELGKFAEAENFYNNILETNADNIHAALALAEIYNKKGEYDRALDILERYDDIYPAHPRVQTFKIQVLFNKSQYKAAGSLALDFFKAHKYLDKEIYTCQECQYESNKPLWICPQCKSIGSFNI